MGEFGAYPHAPSHLFVPESVYMVTAGTYRKKKFFNREIRLQKVVACLFQQAKRHSWTLHAWAILPNHNHIIGTEPSDPFTLVSLIRGLHSITAKYVNHLDRTSGRRVWHNYWDTCLTNEAMVLTRMKYVHMNLVKHGLVSDPGDYPYCSYKWFVVSTTPWLRKKVLRQKLDNIRVHDSF